MIGRSGTAGERKGGQRVRDATIEREEARGGAVAAPEAVYLERRARFGVERDHAQRARYAAANATVALFLAALALIIAGLAVHALLLTAAGILAGAGFVVAFRRQGQADERHRRAETLWRLSEEGLARPRRDWKALPLRRPETPPPMDGAALDLDLLGHASLQHLLNTATTPPAQSRLQGWLLTPATPATIRARQAAVAELAPDVELREELTLFGLLSGMTQGGYDRFLEWAEGGPWLSRRPALLWASRILPALALLAVAASLLRLTDLPLWLIFVAANIVLAWTAGKEVERRIDAVAERQAVFQPYAAIFARVEGEAFQAPALRAIQSHLTADGMRASVRMRHLGRIMAFADLRHSSLIFPPVQALTLWSFHVLWALEGWQRTAGARARRWLEALGELEALAALGTLAFDNPDWAFPEIVEGEAAPALEARDLGHPLLAPGGRVGNDVTVGPRGTLLLVTGSNMSGKSTLLRAIGVNVTLAQAGGPVCATALRLPPLVLATSMRVADSLEEGVSYFLAELRRLKAVVETAERAEAARQDRSDGREGTPERTALFLLDEILHGTNTAERQTAVRHILLRLLALGAIGAVSTHDLGLVRVPEIAAVSRPVYFTETFTRGPEGPAMTFDYTLRPGIAPSTNALKLMEIVGLPVENGEPGGTST